MSVNLGTTSNESTVAREKLTHVAAELGLAINAYITPRPGADKEPEPIAHIHIHYGDGRGGGLGMTVTDPDLLMDAGMVLMRAGQMLRQDQAAHRGAMI